MTVLSDPVVEARFEKSVAMLPVAVAIFPCKIEIIPESAFCARKSVKYRYDHDSVTIVVS